MDGRYQYVVVRYVPNVIRDEGVNVGVIVRDLGTGGYQFRFLSRSATVRKLWPTADQRLVGHFERQLARAQAANGQIPGIQTPEELFLRLDAEFFSRARAEFNGNLQLTEPRGLLSKSLEEALREAYETYVALPQGAARPINYHALAPYQLRERLWTAFERRNLLRRGFVERQLVLKGKHAPWTFDLGYRNGRLSVINSIALDAPLLETNLGRSLVLKGMLEEVRATEDVQGIALARLPKNGSGGVAEALEILRDADIQVFETKMLGDLVDSVERDLVSPRRKSR